MYRQLVEQYYCLNNAIKCYALHSVQHGDSVYYMVTAVTVLLPADRRLTLGWYCLGCFQLLD
jgi:hypothetical protein